MTFFHQVSTIFPLSQWGFPPMTRRDHLPRGHGGIAYESYSITWLSRCLYVMSTVKNHFYSLLIDYSSVKMGSI